MPMTMTDLSGAETANMLPFPLTNTPQIASPCFHDSHSASFQLFFSILYVGEDG